VGYQRKELQILGGSLDLTNPGDKVQKQNYLLSQNFRPDRTGRLVSRYGFPLLYSIASGGVAHTLALAGGVEGDKYLATASGAVYYNAGTTPIVTGLSPYRPGMVYMNGWMWIIDRLKQGRHNNASGWEASWIPVAPTGAPICAAGSSDAFGPNGTYQFYVTFELSDDSLESNPGPGSTPIALTLQDCNLTVIPLCGVSPPTGLTWKRNIYASGGELGQAYLVGTINDNTTTTFTATMNDLAATNQGIVMPLNNDPPPAASGAVGPYFSRLIAFSTADHPNRLFWTDPNLPQYWPGSTDEAEGNWVDVGQDGEPIVWCTLHINVLMIYKERSIWRLVGDPDTGTLEQVEEGTGLVGPWAVASADAVDYFIAPGGLRKSNLDKSEDISAPLRPIFQENFTNAGNLTAPGYILPGSAYHSDSEFCYAAALGYGMGKLYLTYYEAESGEQSPPIFVLDTASGKWTYFRAANTFASFQGFCWTGVEVLVLGGNSVSAGGAALVYSLDDFRAFYTTDNGAAAIICVYQSHFEDCDVPDSQKVWLEVVVDYEFAGDTATVYVGADTGKRALTSIGTITGTGRFSASFALGLDSATNGIVHKTSSSASTVSDGLLAKNLTVAIQSSATARVIIHNVYLYYYEEARLATSASTVPLDLGSAKVKQCKELELDIDASGGAVGINVYSDLPGNALAVRQTPSIPAPWGRALIKFPFSVTEGYLWRLALTAASSAGPFRLYSARLLMRVMGTYIEAYEAAAGFVWDSMEESFESLITRVPRAFMIALAAAPIKRFREISLEIDTFNANVTVAFLTDLPGNAQTVRETFTVNSGAVGRRFVRLPLPAGISAPVEGRMCRLQISGANKFVLYEASVELLPIGLYIEAYEASAGALYDSREMDFGSPGVKEARELELDIETTGSVGVSLLSDISSTYTSAVSTTGRQKVLLPLTISAALEGFVEGRLLRLILSGTNAFRLYDAKLKLRAFGQYLTASETSGGALWDTTDLDLGTQTVKQLRELQLDIWAYGSYTVTVYTDLPGNAMASRQATTLSATTGRTAVQIPLPQGSVPDNYLYGRLVRVTITSASAFKLFGARIHARPIGVYVESYESAGGAVWDSTPSDLGNPSDKIFDELRFEMDTDGSATVQMYTDLPGESFASRGTFVLASSSIARRWVTVPLPSQPEGRSVRLVVTGASAGFRLYKAQVRSFRVGRYLCGSTASGNNDALNTLEFDFASERQKSYQKIEIDMRADNPVPLNLFTEQSGGLSQMWTTTLSTTGRMTQVVYLPPGIRGRLLRLQMTGGPARIYKLRVWARPLNEPNAKWDWQTYPLEESDVLPQWSDLPVEATPPAFSWSDLPVTATPPECQWASFPVNPTPPGTLTSDPAQWQWGKFLSVEETSDTWQWIDVPFSVEGS